MEKPNYLPVNKDSLTRYRIEDKLLSDPSYDYTTEMILRKVNKEVSFDDNVTLRMIQKDIKALEEEFGKEMIGGAAGRGTVKYKEWTQEQIWIDLLRKKLDLDGIKDEHQPVISFSRNDGLQIPETLLGIPLYPRLYH